MLTNSAESITTNHYYLIMKILCLMRALRIAIMKLIKKY